MKLVLLDLDNTLIDGEYRLNVPENEFRSVVQELADKDVCVGLCSDSAVITLRQWADRLGLTGPIVAERGAVIWDSVKQTEQIIELSKTAWFRDFRESFINVIMRNFVGSTLMIGDATKFVKDPCMNAALTQQVFAVNGFRVASFSFFACRPKDDHSMLEPDSELLKCASALAEEMLTAYGKKKEDLFWDENSPYGILILHAQTTEKWRGISALIDQLAPEQTFMVGDGISDFLNLPHVAQYAVGNADPSYKAKATFIAEQSLTKGVIECLRKCV